MLLDLKDLGFRWSRPAAADDDGQAVPLPALGFGIPLAELGCDMPDWSQGLVAETARFEDAVRRCWARKSSDDRLVIVSAFGTACPIEPADEYAPLNDPDLYREFAALSPTAEAVCAFAGRRGRLAFDELIVAVDTKGTPIVSAEVDRTGETHGTGRGRLVWGEPVSLWRDEVFALRLCLEIDAVLRARDVGAMRQFVEIGKETFSWLLSEEDHRRLLREPADKTSFLLPETRWRQIFGSSREVPPATRTHGNEPRVLERMLRGLVRRAVCVRLKDRALGLQPRFEPAAPVRGAPGSLSLECGCLLTAIWAQAAAAMARRP
jgi:hypothetical protein